MQQRICNKCNKAKDLTEENFHRNPKSCNDPLRTICKVCVNKQEKERRAEKKKYDLHF